jgi:hypothetical protein
MKTKLTLVLDEDLVERAKSYAERHGTSLPQMVEGYLAGLRHEQQDAARTDGVVGELTGLLGGIQIDDEKEGYTEYLTKKYS